MHLKRVMIEVRRNLNCANIFLEYEHLASNGMFQVKIEENEVNIKEQDSEYIIITNEDFSIVPNSLSSLIVEEQNISFRLRIDFGTEKNYISQVTDSNGKSADIIRPELAINRDVPLMLICGTCQVEIFDNPKTFQRILEFPSGPIDMSEFFCHHGPDLTNSITPRLNDMFYGFYFVILNSQNLVNVRTQENYLHCRRCLSYLGSDLFNGKGVKLWNDCISMKNRSLKLFKTTNSALIIKELIQNIIYECSMSSEVHCIQFAKVIIEAQFPNQKSKYILLNVIEKNLQILRDYSDITLEKHIKMQKSNAFKVLFKIEDNEYSDILCSWKRGFNAHSITISSKLFDLLASSLIAESNILPIKYRYSGEFLISYVYY